MQANSSYLVSMPRQRSGEVIVLDSEGGSQGSHLQAEITNGLAESKVSSHSLKEALEMLGHYQPENLHVRSNQGLQKASRLRLTFARNPY